MSEAEDERAKWLLLIHQLPPKPSYLRVKVWRRLQGLGAVAIKNSVYVLPRTEQTREDLEWVLREIGKGGGEGSLCEARFVEGLTDEQVQALFVAARDGEYRHLVEELRALEADLPPARKALPPAHAARLETALVRLSRRLGEIVAVDFFGSPGREVADGLLGGLRKRLGPTDVQAHGARRLSIDALRDRTWVTRKGVHIDRIASAWLVRRFIDPRARLKFVPQRGYRPEPGEVRYDMFEGEFTHEGDLCTFEVLCAGLDLKDGALGAIAEIVHDIDLKDAKFGRPETAGVDHIVAGLAMAHGEDEERIERGRELFDALYEYFRRKRRE